MIINLIVILAVALQCSASLSRLPIDSLLGEARVRSVQANCWTCAPGWAHWWDFGLPIPGNGDPCQCIRGTPPGATTTKAPSVTTTKSPATTVKPTPYCWTCPAGYAHWWELGMAEPADKCACAPIKGSTTKAPSTTTKAPATTVKPTPSCWTCAPGYAHWWELGMAEPADKCACAPISSGTTTKTPSTTTKAPSTTKAPATTTKPTPYCWTCSPGYVHWYDIPGYPEPSDQCACVPSTAATTTKTPSTTKTPATTKAPATTSRPTPYCWTCPAGMAHWYEIGMSSAPGGDQCACVWGSPSSTTTTAAPQGGGSSPTSAPTGTMMQKFLAAMTPTASSPGSVSFSACVAPYSPWNPPPADLTKQLLNKLITSTNYRTIMVYSLDQWIAGYAAAAGVKVLGIIYLTGDWTSNANNINLGITAAKMYPDTVVAISCGNEAGMNLGATSSTAAIINNCVTQVRNAGIKHPVGCIDTPSSWIQSGGALWTTVSNNLDWMGANVYPWFDNLYSAGNFQCSTPDNVGPNTLNTYNNIQSKYSNKPLVLTEAGWPSSYTGGSVSSPANFGNGRICTTAGNAEQKKGVQNILDTFRAAKKPINMFSSFREAWKGSSSTSFEEYWGFCSGNSPFNCDNAPR